MKNFDIVRTSEYVVTESKLVNNFKSKFEYIDIKVDPNNYRETYILNNGNEPQIRYQMQSQVRKSRLQDILVYLDFPISFFSNDIKSTTHGNFDYNLVKEFCKELDIENITGKEIAEKSAEWRDQFIPEQYWSFMKYGQLGTPLIDRPHQLFFGSSHSLFSAHLAKFKSMPLYIQIPKPKKKWFMKMPGSIFKSKFTYLFYIDLEEKSLWGKKSYDPNSLGKGYEFNDEEMNLNNYTRLL